MVKGAWLLFWLSLTLSASALRLAIDMAGEETYRTHRQLFALLFENARDFVGADGAYDLGAIAARLKSNGLLDLSYPSARPIEVRFECVGEGGFLVAKVLRTVLGRMGVAAPALERVVRREGETVWRFRFVGAKALDPEMLQRQLQKFDARLEAAQKAGVRRWRYRIDLRDAALPARRLEARTTDDIVRPVRPVWLDVTGLRSVTIREKPGSHWYPEVTVYDKMLHALSATHRRERTRYLRLRLPEGARYLRISDAYTIENLRNGLRIDAGAPAATMTGAASR